ncbi:hypothetical protein HK102_012888, partial [Quaeritorhiza haematococci]
KAPQIESVPAVPSLSQLPGSHSDYSVSVITPPAVTVSVVKEAHSLGIKNVWLQPGAEDPEAVAFAKENGMNLIWGGPCILVSGYEAKKGACL